jgi:uncharacterized protein (DUF736 family)
MSGTYPPGGALFANDRKTNDKQPDYRGNLEISVDLLKLLVEQHKGGEKISMDVAGWKKTSKSGTMFLSIKADKPYKKEEKSSVPVFDEAPF